MYLGEKKGFSQNTYNSNFDFLGKLNIQNSAFTGNFSIVSNIVYI